MNLQTRVPWLQLPLPATAALNLGANQVRSSDLGRRSWLAKPLLRTQRHFQKTHPVPAAATCGLSPQCRTPPAQPSLALQFCPEFPQVVVLDQVPSLPSRRSLWLVAFLGSRHVRLPSAEVDHGSPAHSSKRPAESGQATEVCQKSSFVAILEIRGGAWVENASSRGIG